MTKNWIAVLLVAAASAGLSAGAPLLGKAADASDPSEQTVTLDVIVTDQKNRAIAGLKAADFQITDSGAAREIEAVTQNPGGNRLIGIFLDEFHVEAGPATERARAALLQFVRTQLRDGDRLALMKPLDSLYTIAFTSDRSMVERAIEEFNGRKNDFTPRSELESNLISRAPATAAVSRAQVVTAGTQALAKRLGEEGQGRKALILVSEGFQSVGSSRGIVYAANRNGVAIYPVDPRSETVDAEPESFEATTRMLAAQTGGSAISGSADLGHALVTVTQDLDTYHLVTYRAPRAADGRFHPVELLVKRPNATTRARSGYWAADGSAARAPGALARANVLPVRPSRSSPYIQPWLGMARNPNGTTEVTMTWEPGAAPPRNQRVAMVNLKVMTEDGKVLSQQQLTVPGRVAFEAPPGRIAVELGLQGMNGVAIDTDYRIVIVPNLRVTKPTFGTPQFFRTRNAREFSQVSIAPDASPTAARRFSRTERLLVRIPIYGADVTPNVRATLLNVGGDPMRDLDRVPANLPDGTVQFDLPLASLAPSDYGLLLTAANPEGAREETREVITFRVTN